jgi:hypothetical protein
MASGLHHKEFRAGGHISGIAPVIQNKQYVFSLGAWAGEGAPRIYPAPFFLRRVILWMSRGCEF